MAENLLKALEYIAQITVAVSAIVAPIVVLKTKRKNAHIRRRSNHR